MGITLPISGRDAYRREAEAFAAAGVVTLIYDKRAGYSRATTSFADLADDALAGARLLRERPEVAAGLVGLWGHSQGGWVVPLAASRSPDVAFAVTVSASGLTTDRTQLWSNRTRLRHDGVAGDLVEPIGGRPPAWLALRLGALATVAVTVTLAVRRRSAFLLTGAAVFVPWAAYWGLFTP